MNSDQFGIAISIISVIVTIAAPTYSHISNKSKDLLDAQNKIDKINAYNIKLAHDFIIDHDSEIEWLPRCMIADSISDRFNYSVLTKANTHFKNIFIDYIKQSPEVKTEIARQKGIRVEFPKSNLWMSQSFDLLKNDIIWYELSGTNHCYLYDNQKYFHNALKYHYDKEFCELSIPKGVLKPKSKPFDLIKDTFSDYIIEFIRKFNNEESRLEDGVPLPLDYANEVSSNNKLFECYMIEFIITISNYLYDYEISQIFVDDLPESNFIVDYYYDALINLYLAYSSPTDTNIN